MADSSCGWHKLVTAVGAGIGVGAILGCWLSGQHSSAPEGSPTFAIEGLSEQELAAWLRATSEETRSKLRAALNATAATTAAHDLSRSGQSLSQRLCGQPFADGGLPLFLQSGEWQGNFWAVPPAQNERAEVLKQEQEQAGVRVDLPAIQRKGWWDWNQATPSADDIYSVCEEAARSPEIEEGRWQQFVDWFCDAGIYPGVKRDITVYIPQACTDQTSLGIMVFQDGPAYSDEGEHGVVKAGAVIDTLIHRSQLPNLVAIFITPGRGIQGQRSLEYDTMTDAYVRFLDEELLPFVEAQIGLKFSADPGLRGICGHSSGGMCAFNAAWHRPHSFGRVLSHCGSYTALRGGHNYPFLVRATARKPIRVVLTTGEEDLDEMEGNWALANHTMADALRWRVYDYRYDYGKGHHSLPHGGSLLAEHLRWLFRSDDSNA